jgi:hypothetical protein
LERFEEISGRVEMDIAGLWVLGVFLGAFVLGFHIRKAMDTQAFQGLHREIEALETSLQGAETLLSAKVAQTWNQIEGFDQDRDSGDAGLANQDDEPDVEDADVSAPEDLAEEDNFLDLALGDDGADDGRVCIKKVIGRDDRMVKLYACMSGLAQNRPVVGERYRILLEDGSVLNTSVVTKVLPGYIQTINSVYEIEALELDSSCDAKQGGSPFG